MKKEIYNMKKVVLIMVTLFVLGAANVNSQRPFITLWRSDAPGGNSANDQIIIPAEGDFYYEWYEYSNPQNTGNGKSSGITTITFPSPGAYFVHITPAGRNPFHRITFNMSNDCKKIMRIDQWGDVRWSSFTLAYYGASNLQISANDIPDLRRVTEMISAFSHTGISTVPHMGRWNVSNVNSMIDMFSFTPLFNEDIRAWDVSNVQFMGHMFQHATRFNQNIEKWDVSNVTSMSYMFNGASSFNQPLNRWNVGKVADMSGMFLDASSFDQPLSRWDVQNVEQMTGIFSYASKFNQDLSQWDLYSLGKQGNPYGNNISFAFSGLDCMNYSRILYGWSNKRVPKGIVMICHGLKYSPNIRSNRDKLIQTYGWQILYDALGTCNIDFPPRKRGFSAIIKGNELMVMIDGKELNKNDQYSVEISNDGTHFREIGDLKPAFRNTPEGNLPILNLEFNLKNNKIASVMGLGILGLLSISVFKRRYKMLILVIISFVIFFTACRKNNADVVTEPEAKDIYVRLVQKDTNGNKQYSEVIKAVREF
ncbi:MAG TPA: BspA family leucine-rich repeat surface protein [Niabella sp.]|jgi:surface protein|nr:BspA family leucine-rich repeat surface protein [Chitinophagaceae bacterium]HRN47417.1 BspA family leucine-rich repeat surface protein [Niabella sp.]HRO85041.1 BspA family leucine-rich repeat surface protein [Niabella sp.]